MDGHIFMSVGDLETAARFSEEAAAADRELSTIAVNSGANRNGVKARAPGM